MASLYVGASPYARLFDPDGVSRPEMATELMELFQVGSYVYYMQICVYSAKNADNWFPLHVHSQAKIPEMRRDAAFSAGFYRYLGT